MTSLLLVLHHKSPVPPYEQIAEQLRTMIALAQLVPGEQLPSVRQLARDLNVAPNTIVRAYAELEQDGWVTTSARKGVKVATRTTEIREEDRQSRLTSAVTELLVVAYQLGVSPEEVSAEIDRQVNIMSKQEANTP
jgi:GntR family transcriptional regulator